MKINMNGTNGKNLRDLVGHMVCRTTPIYQNRYNGFAGFPSSEPNYKYCDLREAVKVIKVVNDVVLVERKSDKYFDKTESEFVLDTVHPMFDDDNWKVVDEVWNILSHKSASANDFRRLHVVEETDTNGRCNGVDDILFNSLLTEAERCKNFDGENDWYWLDTHSSSPNASNSTGFMNVVGNGYPSDYSSASSYTFAVIPCFLIRN